VNDAAAERGDGALARAAEKAYLTVRERILRGSYPPAMRLTEQEVASASGVSRTPVREALRRLQAEGYVTAVANQGAVVAYMNREEVNDLFELRALLEPYGAARAAERVSAEALAELRELAQRQQAESERRSEGYIERIGELNSRFHRMVHEASGNTRLARLIPALLEAPLVLKTFTRYEPHQLRRSAAHHLEIVSALESRDPQWAFAIMRTHILAAHDSERRRAELEPDQA
jgi:DNA-binding GntR family transcriptional regulator